MISKLTTDRILERCDIMDIAKDCCPDLKKAGAIYRACCPFHQEDTPSFTIYPNKNRFICFGCGEKGDTVSLLMKMKNLKFTEAISELGKRYGIEVEKSHLTEKEEQEYRTKEAMWAANERLMQVYEQQLQANEKAKQYAYKRWGESFCQEFGIGYCPKWAKLVDSAKITPEISDQLGLKFHGGYDFFNGRVVIPIRDRQKRIIGFTARKFPDDGGSDKYYNSKESLIYKKMDTLFGIDQAWGEAEKKDKMYIVEGAPDCMRMQIIGLKNTIAPLGTALTNDHLELIKRKTSQICFLPDADTPKDNERYGRGILAVMKNGETAIKMGFSVSVKQIPLTEEKQDPDSYFTSIRRFKSVEELSFVEWMEQRLYEENMSANEEVKCIEQITLFGLEPKAWVKQVRKQQKLLTEEEVRQQEMKESQTYRKYGFNISEKNYYYSYKDNGSMMIWSNFTVHSIVHVKSIVNSKRLYILKNTDNIEELVEMKPDELVGITKFKIKVESMGNFLWKAGNVELEKLKAYLYSDTKSAIEVKQLGWQPVQKVYAFGNGVFDGERFIKVDEYGLVKVDKNVLYLPSQSKLFMNETKLFEFEKRFVHLGLSNISMREFTDLLFLTFGNNGRLGFMYVMTSLFRDIVRPVMDGFPILNLFGPRGTGKTMMANILMSFFVTKNKPANLKNTTSPALSDEVARTANAMVHIDEYKNDIEPKFIEFLKGLWDGSGRNRKNMDLDKKNEMTAVETGVILSGQEMTTADDALFSRVLFLTFSKTVFTQEEQNNYERLKAMGDMGNTHLTMEILRHRKKVEVDFQQVFKRTKREMTDMAGKKKVDDRIINNWASILSMQRCLEAYIDTSLAYKDMLRICVECMIRQNSLSKQNNELSTFWKVFNFLKTEGELMENGDYKIRYTDRLKTDITNAEWSEPKAVLIFHKTRAFELYRLQGRRQGENIIPEASLEYYLKNSSEYLGYKGSYRFTNFVRGIQQQDSQGRAKSSTYSAYCFDYDALRRNYDIDLENRTVSETESDDGEEKKENKKLEEKQTEIPF